jgi:predicted alpha-1,6-mannanase (GH76 family)
MSVNSEVIRGVGNTVNIASPERRAISRRQALLMGVGGLAASAYDRLSNGGLSSNVARLLNIARIECDDLEAYVDHGWDQIEVPKDATPEKVLATQLYNGVKDFSTPDDLMRNERGDFGLTAVWPLGRLWQAMAIGSKFDDDLGAASRRSYGRIENALQYYWYPERKAFLPHVVALATSIETFDDDNLWLALTFAQHYEETQEEGSLRMAALLYKSVISQWICKDGGGGVPWEQQLDGVKSGPVAVSNAPAVILGQWLYTKTRDRFYNRNGADPDSATPDVTEIYDWVMTHLYDSKAHLLYDGLSPGSAGLLTNRYTYEQGVGAAAAAALGHTTTAIRMINATLDMFDGVHSQIGIPNAPVSESDNAFNGIFFEYAIAIAEASEDRLFHARVLGALHETVSHLKTSYPTLLEHAGALHLANLACLYPSIQK